MNKLKKLSLILFCIMLCVSGCGNNNDEDSEKMEVIEAIHSEDYRIAVPYNYTDTRETHIQFNRSGYDVDAVGEGLLRYSKDYFDVNKYYLQEGQFLRRNTLQAGLIYGDKEGLLGSKSKTNPYGLNPENGMKIPTEDGKTIVAKAGSGGTIPVVDVFEVNFITELKADAEIKGVSLAIVLNPNVVDADGKEHIISDDNLMLYGEEAGRNLVAFLKQQSGMSTRTPILVAIFKADSSDTTLPGTYIALGQGNGNVDKFHKVEEEWVIIPSDEANAIDSNLVAQFNTIKGKLYDFLPNNTEIIGKGFFVDKRIQKLKLQVNMYAKTYTEKIGVTQYVCELLSQISNTDIDIVVRVQTNSEMYAMIHREKGSDKCEVITYD